jgi:hypothetical protein
MLVQQMYDLLSGYKLPARLTSAGHGTVQRIKAELTPARCPVLAFPTLVPV